MWYNDLRPKQELLPNKYALIFLEDKLKMSESDKKRTLKNLIELKKGLEVSIPKKEMDTNILIASWNIKELGHLNKRLPETYMYMAEVISAFDIIAIQEIKRSLFDLDLIMRILGKHYKYVITDITDGAKGNKERFGCIYDTRRVNHSGLSGELVVSPENSSSDILRQLKRTPAITGFESGWKKFSIINVHLHPGNGTKDKKIRHQEVTYIINQLQEKIENKYLWCENLIILGDTNLYENNTNTLNLIKDAGFKECESLIGKPTTTSMNEIYDRIFFNVNPYYKLKKNKNGKDNGGVFNIFDYVLKNTDVKAYHDIMKGHKGNPDSLKTDADFDTYFHRFWKRNQLSDHLPIWVEIEADSSVDFLTSKHKKINL